MTDEKIMSSAITEAFQAGLMMGTKESLDYAMSTAKEIDKTGIEQRARKKLFDLLIKHHITKEYAEYLAQKENKNEQAGK